MYNINLCNKRAMGNAFLLNTFSALDKVIILCDGGEMQILKALREKRTHYKDVRRISNIQADAFQMEGIATFEIEEV